MTKKIDTPLARLINSTNLVKLVIRGFYPALAYYGAGEG